MHQLPDSAPTDELALDLENMGRTLVAALRDQFADGQVEALYSLQSAATLVRKHTASLTEVTQAQTSAVLEHVTTGFELLLREALASIGEQIATEVDASTSSMVASAADVASQLVVTEESIRAVSADSEQRAADARDALQWAAEQGARSLSTAATTLSEQSSATEAALAAAGAALSERVEAVAKSAERRIATATEQALATLKAATAETKAELAAARASADQALDKHVAALHSQLAAQTKRDVALSDRLQDQVEALVQRTDATAGETVRLLQQALTALSARDDVLEQRRAEAFARVLEDVLSQGGGSNRKLRDRIRRGLDAQPPLPVPTVIGEPVVQPLTATAEPAAPPAVPPPAPSAKTTARKAPAPAKTTSRKAPAPRPVAVNAPTKKATAKKAAAKRAPAITTPTDTSDPEAST